MSVEQHTERQLLEAIEDEPETTQADLAAKAGVAVGTVNWYLKRWTTKGMIKVKRIGRWRWRYLLTPQGISEKAHLAASYVDYSMTLYRMTRTQAQQLLSEVKKAGYDAVVIDGQGDIADICRLTCLEHGITVTDNSTAPALEIDGMRVQLSFEDTE